jgi:hypothetical protein
MLKIQTVASSVYRVYRTYTSYSTIPVPTGLSVLDTCATDPYRDLDPILGSGRAGSARKMIISEPGSGTDLIRGLTSWRAGIKCTVFHVQCVAKYLLQ